MNPYGLREGEMSSGVSPAQQSHCSSTASYLRFPHFTSLFRLLLWLLPSMVALFLVLTPEPPLDHTLPTVSVTRSSPFTTMFGLADPEVLLTHKPSLITLNIISTPTGKADVVNLCKFWDASFDPTVLQRTTHTPQYGAWPSPQSKDLRQLNEKDLLQ